ncbi:[pyruvate dehydrogenase (acetyl-transferring)] kinase [Sarracenia purpurea var. burkii]
MAEGIVAGGGGGALECAQELQKLAAEPSGNVAASRKERRKAAKKEKRKQKRKELAAKEREEEEAHLNDPEEQLRIQLEEERENERLEKERKEFEEHERLFLEALAAKRRYEEEENARRKTLEDESKQNQVVHEDEYADDEWEYVEEGPPEIIWQGNEIIVKKKKVRVKRKDADQRNKKERISKQVKCEFVGVTKWKVAICGEYMKSRLKTCSRGTACNFIHCFRNPGGDYEWADLDKPPPKHWVKKMVALFGYSEESGYENQIEQGRNSRKMMKADPDRYHSRRSWSRERDSSRSRYEEYDARRSRHGESFYEEYDAQRSRHRERHTSGSRKEIESLDGNFHAKRVNSKHNHRSKNRTHSSDSDADWSIRSREDHIHGSDSDGYPLDMGRDGNDGHRKNAYRVSDDYDRKNITHGTEYGARSSKDMGQDRDMYQNQRRKRRRHQNKVSLSPDNSTDKRDRSYDSDSMEAERDKHQGHMRKHSKHSSDGLGFTEEHGNSSRPSNEGLGSIEEHGNSVNILKGKKNYPEESDLEELEPQKTKKWYQSSRGDHRSSTGPSEANFCAAVLKSHKDRETTCSSSLHEPKLRDMDSRYNSNENIDKVGRPRYRGEFSLKQREPSTESSNDESNESHNRIVGEVKNHNVSGYSSDEGIEKRGRWESDEIGPENHRPSKRKPDSDDTDLYGGKTDSRDLNSDVCHKESRSGGGGWSSSRKSLELDEVDSAEECRVSEEKRKQHHISRRTRHHKGGHAGGFTSKK